MKYQIRIKAKKEDITNKLTLKKISDKEYVYTMSHKNFYLL